VKPVYFRAIFDGLKRTEWRFRRRVDPRLEAIEIGEPIVLLEIGSDRAIKAKVRAIIRFDYLDGGHLYAIRLANPRLSTAPGVRKVQGWHRRRSL
jgi:hypothetical protein